ncbi:MAG: LysR family transcriptional regulator [Lachnospiraceae bacterium]|nr:LysR family transcriptional regulator [Lachnospiraceae bacterium]
MKLQQLEYFIAVSKYGSLGKAAAQLYTSQPNVSKVIHTLETELGHPLFERTTRGLRLNSYGKAIYEYASDILKNAELIAGACSDVSYSSFHVSTYQSNTLARLLVQLYKRLPELRIEHRQGNVEEVIGNVENGVSELGIIYISRKYKQALLNILAQKRLEFHELGTARACISVGPASPLYEKDSIPYAALSGLRYVRGIQDYFSEDSFTSDNIGIAATDALQAVVSTNNNQMVSYLVQETDLAYFSIDLTYDPEAIQKEGYKILQVTGSESAMVLGYIAQKDYVVSTAAEQFIDLVRHLFSPKPTIQM